MHFRDQATLGQCRRNRCKSKLPLMTILLTATVNASGAEETINLELPAQALSATLDGIAKSSRTKLIYADSVVKGLRADALKGAFTPRQALEKALGKSGLKVDSAGEALVIAPSNNSSSLTLPAVTVTGKAGYADNDPYNPHYNRATATTATKTDTPIMLTPASIQVVPKAVMNDQQNINILDSLNRNVSGVSARTGSGVLYDNFIIRGFTTGLTGNAYRNGLLFPSNFYEPSNIEQLEVMKGPVAALYGRIEPGGIVNITTKKPLATPYYSLQQQFGSYDLYRTTVDATGPIDDAKMLLYRFNATYLNKGSFKEMVSNDRVFIAPTLSWRPNDKFEANVELEYKHDNFVNDYGVPVLEQLSAT